jgi:hypothetical protein
MAAHAGELHGIESDTDPVGPEPTEFYRSRADLDEQLDEARQEWAARTAPMRPAAMQADSLLRRRHPQILLKPLRSAEPEPLPDELPGRTSEANQRHAELVAGSLAGT